jgi:predicted AlkP superfamily phosphohydrolase/phosphomutase
LTQARTLVVSLDCVNARLLDALTESGQLPALARLRQAGGAAFTRGLGLSAEGDWLSFYTGLEPSVHGHIAYDEIIPGTYRSRLTSTARTATPPFYQELAENGQDVIVLNPVHVGISALNRGCVVTNFHGHDTAHYFPLASHPPELAIELGSRFPDDPVHANDWGLSKWADPERLLRGKRETLRRKIAVFEELIEREPWEFAYLGLDECHEMSHLFWHLHDRQHPRFDSSDERRSDPVLQMLTEIDTALDGLMKKLPPDCLVVVLSIAGIGGNYHWSHLVDELLDRFEGGSPSQGSYQTLRNLWNSLPHTLQRPLHSARHHFRESLLERRRSKRRAFAMPLNEVAGGVRINLEGREPKGRVQLGEYDSLCEELTEKFVSLKCTETSQPLVSRVIRSSEALPGPYLDRMPDLIIEWNTECAITAADSDSVGEIRREFNDARTGHHINEGIVLYSNGSDAGSSEARPVSLAAVGQALLSRQLKGQDFGESLLESQVLV